MRTPVSRPSAAGDQGDAPALGPGHRQDGVLGRDRLRRHRQAVAGPHDVARPQQEHPAEVAGRMVLREIVAGQPAGLEQDHGQGVARGRGRRWCSRSGRASAGRPRAARGRGGGGRRCGPGRNRACPVKATIFRPKRRSSGTSRRSSSDWPLLLSSRARSPSSHSPRSPCSAWVESRKQEETPVLLKVAAIFCAMWADLPTPLKISLPPARDRRRRPRGPWRRIPVRGPRRSPAARPLRGGCRRGRGQGGFRIRAI